MNSIGYFTLSTVVILVCVLLYVSVRIQIKIGKAHRAEQEQKKRLALQLHPVYRQKLQEERTYTLEHERLELARAEQEQQHRLDYERLQLQREKQNVELLLAQRKQRIDEYLALTRVNPETYIINAEPEHITAFPSLKRIAEEKEKTPDYLRGQHHQQPTQDFLLSQIKPNSLTVSPGIKAEDGKIVIVDIVNVPHLKLIGASGFGKSCLAGSIMHQLISLNSPRIFQLATLDLEHKTSRLFEDAPHIAQIRIGKRLIQCVATNPDEVAEHLGFLKVELDRRTALSEQELAKQPVLIMYVEEMLSLQFEVDPKLLARMFADLTILSVRGRKYGMFLLACMQTDYSTNELKISQKMYRFRAAAAIDTTAARAAGFMNTELVKANFQHGEPGQFVVEYPGFSSIVLASQYDWKVLLQQKTGFQDGFRPPLETENLQIAPAVKHARSTIETTLKTSNNDHETALQAKEQQVRELKARNWGKIAIIKKIWRANPGETDAYKQADAEYNQIMQLLEQEKSTA